MNRRRAFNLVELLVSIAIIGILMAITLPAVNAVRASAQRTSCGNNVRQIALAALNYESNLLSLPIGCRGPGDFEYATWLVALLPHVEQSAMWSESQTDFKWGVSPFSQRLHQTPVKLYGCPSDGRSGQSQWTHGPVLVALTSYAGVSGIDRTDTNGVLIYDRAVKLSEISDGQSSTLMFGERPPSPDNWYGWWYAGTGQSGTFGDCDMLMGIRETNLQVQYAVACPIGPYRFSSGQFDEMCDAFHFWSPHRGGAYFGLCDGSAKFFPYDAVETVELMATRNGYEVVTEF